jgi:acetyl-CoA acetyltransferase
MARRLMARLGFAAHVLGRTHNMISCIPYQAAIVGVGKSRFARDTGRTTVWQIADALRAALDDSGLTHRDIDALYVNGGGDFDKMAEQLGLSTTSANQFWLHGRMSASTIQAAALAVAAGLANHVACVYAIDISERGGGYGGGRSHSWEEFREGGGAHGEMACYGLTHPGSGAAMAWQMYKHRYGATDEQLAHVAVTTRAHARLNPDAMMRGPMSVEDYLASRFVIEPLRLFDFALVNDGAVCIIVSSAERARDCRKPPIYVAGLQGLHAGREEFVFGSPGLGVWQQTRGSADPRRQRVYQMAGVGHADIDLFYCLDSFSPLVIFALEEFGFCAPGEAAAWVAEGNSGRAGCMPVNTHGGHLSEGMLGSWSHHVEAVRQLRKECGERQVESAQFAQFGMGQGASIIYSNQLP